MTLMRLVPVSLAASLVCGVAFAKSNFKSKIPNGSVNGCATCHTSTSPAAWNAFGLDVEDTLVGISVDWSAVCDLDSDGDGWTNGEELLDPDCTWSVGDPDPGSSADVTKPGDANDVPPEPEPEPDVIEGADVVEADVAEPGPEADVSEPGPEPDAGPAPEEDTSAPTEEDASGTTPLDAATPDNPLPCEIHEDCPEGYGCAGGQCTPWVDVPCQSHAGCPEGYDCFNGFCTPWGAGCTDDSDCYEAQACVALDDDTSECQDIVCTTSDDCPGGFDCILSDPNFCQPSGMPYDEEPDPTPQAEDDAPSASSDGGGCQSSGQPGGRHLVVLMLGGIALALRRRVRLS